MCSTSGGTEDSFCSSLSPRFALGQRIAHRESKRRKEAKTSDCRYSYV